MRLDERLRIFRDTGLLDRVPTRWQLLQGEIEMTPYVISTDATSEDGYRDHLMSRPIMRQALIDYHLRHYGIVIEDERICVTSSGMNAMMLIIQVLCGAGDNAVCVTPVWPNIFACIDLETGKKRWEVPIE